MVTTWPVLTTLIFFPLLGVVFILGINKEKSVRISTLIISFIEIVLAIPLLKFKLNSSVFQFVELKPWIEQFNINYHLGIDGISYLMVLLTIFLLPLCVLCSWTYITKRVKEFHICLLLMTSACIGVFVALDFVLFYIFWEAMLIPMFLLIAIWGGPRKKYASIKFFIYTLAGSTLLLVAIIGFYLVGKTFSIPELLQHNFSFNFQFWAFLAMALAFAIKVPMFPFHTWLPAAHVEAPTAGSVLLASVLLKMGTYGFIRFCLGLTPAASIHFAPLMIALSIASILYGGLVALGQTDMKKLIAYSSVAHMGFVTLGIFMFNLRGIEGALMQMLNHGITTGALFMLVGAIYERSHSREISENLGLGKYLPSYMFFFGLFSLSSLAFPGTNSFVGEALVLIGAFTKNKIIGLVAIPGALLAAAYMLRLLQKLAWGSPSKAQNFKDLNKREWAYLLPLAILVFYLGFAPKLALKTMDKSIQKTLIKVQKVQIAVQDKGKNQFELTLNEAKEKSLD
ncbi:NADH-quinone oxidoreductase subunit M [Desulfonauticus submarinus]|uniref:NADH-quinone oxidoreductase subunit M n=1 Tax=Desulfonauticus submarinus TaxID=206665 RepID=A0A1H0GF53_9BACT|nr:NADH-quinone oxidoreductase subunit M [Desulfonauticus submarinus]SDO05488.1 NADH-quinone oxidoreductase subunit M [Desulfonauticus submarinus]